MAKARSRRSQQHVVAEPAVLVVELHADQRIEIPVETYGQLGGVVGVAVGLFEHGA